MKKIKFRAWVKVGENDWHMSKIRWINLDSGTVCTENGLQPEEAILMQYTGLKDKNGREIYEGDILHQRRFICWNKETGEKYKDVYGVVRFEAGIFTCGIIDGMTMMHWDNCEVIGNIYENPEIGRNVSSME